MRRPPNFQTTKILTVLSPHGAGGKFLSLCLSLSGAVVTPDGNLLTQNIQNTRSMSDWINHWLSNTVTAQGTWSDFGIDCSKLWGFAEKRYFEFDPRCAALLTWNPLIVELTHQDRIWLPLLVHHAEVSVRVSTIWPKATILQIVNSQEFINTHRPQYLYDGLWQGKHDPRINIFWRHCRGPDWPLWPPTSLADYQQLPVWIQKEIKDVHDNEILNYFNDPEIENLQAEIDQEKINHLLSRHPSLCWNADNFNDELRFIEALKNLYHDLGFSEFDGELLKHFYRGWIKAMQVQKHQYLCQMPTKTAPNR